jgi:hypothetical protein
MSKVMPEQRRAVPAAVLVPPISTVQDRLSVIGPTAAKSKARSPGPGSGLAGGGEPDSSGAIWR